MPRAPTVRELRGMIKAMEKEDADPELIKAIKQQLRRAIEKRKKDKKLMEYLDKPRAPAPQPQRIRHA